MINKVAWISDTPDAEFIGNSRVCREMIKYFDKQFDVEHVSFAIDEDKVNKITKFNGKKVYNVTRDNSKNMIVESLKRINPDVIVLSHDPWLFLPCIEQIKEEPSLSKCLIVGLFTIDGAPVSVEWTPVLNACDVIFTPSEWGKKELMNFNPGLFVYVIPHGIDHNVFRPFGESAKKKEDVKAFIDKSTARTQLHLDIKDKFVCFFIGNNQDRKGLGASRDAWFKFAEDKNDIRWILVTHPIDAKSRVYYPPTLFEHPTIINFNCNIQEQDLIGFYHCSDYFLYPTMGDGFSLVCLESLACGCTPIVTNWSSQTDFCNDYNSIMLNYTLLRGGFGCYRAIVDSDYLANVLETEYKRWKENKEEFYKQADIVHNNGYRTANMFNWETSTNKMINIIRSFYNTTTLKGDIVRKL